MHRNQIHRCIDIKRLELSQELPAFVLAARRSDVRFEPQLPDYLGTDLNHVGEYGRQ